jgi:Ca2+-binding EF-hand superfamily protein
VDIHELKNILPGVPDDKLHRAFKEADRNRDGRLDRHEYQSVGIFNEIDSITRFI